jgi:hypothetical protein
MCSLISEVGGSRRCFVGDVGAWKEQKQCGDAAVLGTEFGAVWVGHFGKEAEARRALH